MNYDEKDYVQIRGYLCHSLSHYFRSLFSDDNHAGGIATVAADRAATG